jgi:imidazolonepropionase-like amidohydrolase
MSLFDELFLLKQQYPHIKAQQMIKWITTNPAEALCVGNELGSLSEGKLADIIGVRFPVDDDDDIVEQMIQSDLEVVMVMIDGQEIIVNY